MKSESVVKFNSLEEVKAYLSGDKITCLICGKSFNSLSGHIARKHNIPLDVYKERFNIPYTYVLETKELKMKRRESANMERILSNLVSGAGRNVFETRRRPVISPSRVRVFYTEDGVPKTKTELEEESHCKQGSEEHKIKQRTAMKRAWSDPEKNKNLIKRHRRTSEKQAESTRKAWADPEKRKNLMEGRKRASGKQADGLRRAWADPEKRKNLMEGLKRTSEKRAEGIRRAWARRKANQ